LAILIEVLGGLALLLGFRSRASAWALAVYMVPVTLAFHQFWNVSGAQAQQQQIEFMKNLAIIGGLLAMTAGHAGELSLDAHHPRWLERLRHPFHREHSHAA
jgi:putative oxidoreductase